MGCGDVVNWIVDPIGTALGIKGPATLVQPWEWGHLGADIKSDWSKLKHLLVPDMRRDREAMISDSLASRRIIYGRTRVGSQLAYAVTSGAKSEYLHLMVIFCGHVITAFDEIWLDDKLISDPIYSGKVNYTLFNGTQTTACAEMMAASGGLWTAQHRLTGCACGYFRFLYDETAFAAGLPTVKAVIKGKALYDPRSGATVWSDNPALCAYDYMMLPSDQGGMGCDADEVNLASVIAAANRCDETVI